VVVLSVSEVKTDHCHVFGDGVSNPDADGVPVLIMELVVHSSVVQKITTSCFHAWNCITVDELYVLSFVSHGIWCSETQYH
jgi:hypothetical protein